MEKEQSIDIVIEPSSSLSDPLLPQKNDKVSHELLPPPSASPSSSSSSSSEPLLPKNEKNKVTQDPAAPISGDDSQHQQQSISTSETSSSETKPPPSCRCMNMFWNQALAITTVLVMCFTAKEHPNAPLRTWLVIFSVQCLISAFLAKLDLGREQPYCMRDCLHYLSDYGRASWWAYVFCHFHSGEVNKDNASHLYGYIATLLWIHGAVATAVKVYEWTKMNAHYLLIGLAVVMALCTCCGSEEKQKNENVEEPNLVTQNIQKDNLE